ncbi:MAG: hypothetical protein Q7T71_16035 [Herbiconiux sp.]|nr:hypothetical protein [Herbiconiux sp.]
MLLNPTEWAAAAAFSMRPPRLSLRRRAWLNRVIAVSCALVISLLVAPPESRWIALAIGVVGGLCAAEYATYWSGRRRAARLRDFATRIGFEYRERRPWNVRSSLVLGAQNTVAVDTFSRTEPYGRLTIGTLRLEVERAGALVVEHWGFIERTIVGGTLPHVLVHARGSGSRTLPAPLDAGQRLTLEGDFPTHFDAYCPRGSERDALYLLTPDLMAALIDDGNGASLEMSGDRLLFFTPQAFRAESPSAWIDHATMLAGLGERTTKRALRFTRAEAGLPSDVVDTVASDPSPAQLSLTSTSRSNRSTFIVGALSFIVVCAAVIWGWLH